MATINTVASEDSVEVTSKDIEVLQNLEAEPAPKKELTFARFCWDKGVFKCLLPLLVIGGVTAGVMKALGIQPSRDQIPKVFADFIFSRDGWEGLEAEDLPRWNTRGSGVLRLQMVNALDDHWQPYFEKSVEEWNNGVPDVIELSVTSAQPDSGCDFMRGKFA